MGTTGRRRVEITYDANTRGAIAEIKKLAAANGFGMKNIANEVKKTTRAVESLDRAFRTTAGLLAFRRLTIELFQGLRSIVRVTEQYRGENDELVRSFAEVKDEARGFVAALGTVLLGALDAGGGADTLGTKLREMRDDVLDADTALGGLVRSGFTAIIRGSEFVITALGRVTQGFQAILGAVRIASEGLAEFFGAQAARRVGEDLRPAIERLDELEQLLGDPTRRPGERSRLRQEIADQRLLVAALSAEWEARENVADAQTRDREEAIAGLEAELQGTEDLIDGIGELSDQIVTGLGGSFTMAADVAESGARRTGQALREEIAAPLHEMLPVLREFLAGLALLQKGAGLGSQEEALALAGTFGLKTPGGEAAPGALAPKDVIFGKEAELAMLETQRAADETRLSVAGIFGGPVQDEILQGLGSMQDSVHNFLQLTRGEFGSWGLAIRETLGGLMGQIGSSFLSAAAQVIGGASSGPFGLFLALGGAFSILSGLLTGGGGGGRTARSASSVPADVMAGIRPGASRGTQSQVIQLSVGAVFSRDESRRTVAQLYDEAQRLGEARMGR